MSESARIADQLRRAFDGTAGHDPAPLELLKDIDAVTAAAKPIPTVHSIWELALHIPAWDTACLAASAEKNSSLPGTKTFPHSRTAPAAWHKAVAHVKRTHSALVKTVHPCRTRACGITFPASATISGTCCMEWCSTSFTMPDKSPS